MGSYGGDGGSPLGNPSGGGLLGSYLSSSWKNMLGNPGSQGTAAGASAPNNRANVPSNALSNSIGSGGEPQAPGFVSTVLPQNLQDEKNFTSDANFLRSYGNGTGASPWLSLQDSAIQHQVGQSRNQALSDASASQQHALDSVAMNGGLGSGDAARTAGLGLLGQQSALQGVQSQGDQAKANAAATDAQNRLSVAQSMPGTDLNNANFLNSANEFNMNNLNQQRNFNYGQQMQQYGANQVGNAIANSGKKH